MVDLDGLNKLLRESTTPVSVVFTKVDGTNRTMLCTRHVDLLPKVSGEAKQTKKKATKAEPDPDVIVVYDVEKNGWRSFRFSTVVKINGEEPIKNDERSKD